MAYVFDYVNNTLIDDEDKSFGNKFAVLDPDLEKVLQELNEKFGSGTIQEGTQGIPQPPVKTPQAIFEFEERMKGRMAEGGRVNFAAAGLALPALSYPASFGLAKIFGLSTAGVGATELGNKVTDYIQNNPEILNDPRFKAVALTFGINIPGYIAPDAAEMEKEAEKIRELTKPTGSPIEPPIKIDTTTGDSEPPKIDTTEKLPAGENIKPVVEGFPADTEQLPIIFENKKVENVKKKFNRVDELLKMTGTGGKKRSKEIDNIRNKKLADDVKNLIDNTYGGNAQALANDLEIERVRINSLLNKHGIKQERAGNKTIQNIFLKQDEDKLSVVELTDNMKGNETYLIDRTKERFVDYNKNKNRFVNYKDIAEIAGVNLPNKGEQDFFQTKLRAAKKKFNVETKKGFGKEILYPLEETLNALTKYNLSKPIAGTGRVQNKIRREFEQKDIDLFNTRKRVMSSVNETSKNILGDQFIKNAGEEIGHAEAITNQLKFKKLYKNSNANDISTHVYQDPRLNKDVLQKYGQVETAVEQKRQPILSKMESYIGKKRTSEKDNELNILVNELNELNKTARIKILQIQKENKFITDQKNRIPDFKLTLPENSKTYKSGILNIDMSNIDPSVSVGRILEINPDAKTFDDLTEGQQELYIENMKNQMIDYLQYFYQEAKVPKEDIESLVEELSSKKISMGKIKKASGGGVEITPLPRANFGNGGAAGADVDFATELEYFFTNPDTEIPEISTYKKTSNPIEIFNDIIDPRNYPYYADVLVRSGLRIGEFGAKILPATGQLIADAMQKGVFKVRDNPDSRYVQDYDEILPSNIKGTGIFSEFLQNITPTTLEKKVGLASLIEKEEQKQIDRGSTAGPKVFADTIGLGAEVTAPIFPGLKLLNSFAKARNLPNDKSTQKILEKEIDEVLEQRGMNRREFLQATGAGATVVLAKMLGLMDVAPKVAKVARTAPVMDNTVQGMPAWFKDAVYAIERKGILKSRGDIKGIEPDFFEITLDTKLGKKKVLMSKNDQGFGSQYGEITLDWTTSYYDMDIPVTITYRPGQSGKQNFLSDPEFPQSVEKYDVEVEAPEFEYKTVDVESMGPEDTNFDSAINLDIKEEADAVVEALEELGLGLTKKQKKEAAENFRYYNDVELDEGTGPDTMNPLDESDAFPFLDEVKRNK